MNNPIMFIVFLLGLVYVCYNGFFPWFKPQDYFIHTENVKRKVQKICPFLPTRFINFISFDWSPKYKIWHSRIAYLVGVLFCLLGMIAAIWSPDTK
jgi:hypothetical protein